VSAHDTWVARARETPIETVIMSRGVKLRGNVDRCGPCPKCGGDDRFSINTKKQCFNCRSCGARGDVIALVEHLDNCDFIAACTKLAGPRPNGKNYGAEPRKVITASFEYYDETGVFVYQIDRVEYQNPDGTFVLDKDGKKRKKTFSQRRPDPNRPGQWIWNVSGVTKIPYRLPELIEAVAGGYTIFIVEGEGKVDKLVEIDIDATCNPDGAGKWPPEFCERLCGADVVLAPDNDEAGWKHVNEVGASLVGIADRIRVLALPDLPPKGDIRDWLAAGGTREQLEALVEQAPDWQPPQEKPTEGDTQPNVFNAGGLNQMRFEPVKYVVPDYIVEGLTLLAGKPKVGKSWLLLHVAFAVAAGGRTLGDVQCEQGDVLYCALEDNPRRLQSRLTKLFGTRDWPTRLNFTCEMPRLTEGGLNFVKNWIEKAERPRLVIIDTLAMVRMPNRKDQSSYDADYAAVKELRDLALK
jgi:hypothetical protein